VAPEIRPINSPVFNSASGRDVDQVLAELREANERLVVAGVRLQQLAEQASAAQAQAEAANQAKDQFLAALSHELRTPLNAIFGWTHLLRQGGLPAEATDHALEVIERNAKMQMQLIEDLLQVSEMVTGKLRLEAELVDLTSLVMVAIDSLLPAVTSKNIRVTCQAEPGMACVLADPMRVLQIVGNLMSNAIKFTPRDGTIGVVARHADAGVEIVVTDSGVGIDPAFVPYMFEPFRQDDRTSHRASSGMGLGLAIVRGLMELHGGTVKGESIGTGQGSTFTLTFPVPAFTPGRDHVAPPSLSPSLQGMRVLVVEDEPDSRDVLATLLSEGGAVVTAVESAPQALEHLEHHRPDLLIADIGLPHEDGYSLIRKVRALESESANRVPAMALTAYARPHDRAQAMTAGFQMHMAKPIAPEKFLEAVSTLVRQAKDRIR